MWRFIYLAKSQNEKGRLERKGQMWFLFCPPHETSFPNPSPFEYDCSWRLPGSERWKGNPSCKHQPSTLKAPHALFQLSTAPNYMFLTFENALGQQVPLSLVYCSHVITLCLPSPTLNPLLFMKNTIIVLYPEGGKVGRQRRCSPLAHAACFTAWSLSLRCSVWLQLLCYRRRSQAGYTSITRAVTANHWSLITGTLLAAASKKLLLASWLELQVELAELEREEGEVHTTPEPLWLWRLKMGQWISSERVKERQQTMQDRVVVSLQGVNSQGHTLSV